MKKKAFILGIDGASLDLILSEIQKDRLKNFARLINDGSWGNLHSTLIANSSVAWTTFMTGKNPGKHGIYDFFSVKNESTEFVSFSDIEDMPFWDILGKMGKRSFVINCPLTYPPKIENGILVSGFLTPLDKKDFVYPEDFWEEIRRISPGYEVYPLTNIKKDLKTHIEEIEIVLKSQFDLVRYVFKEKEWDVLIYVMQNIDALQHFLWNYIDKTHSQYRYDDFFSNVLFEYYKKMDDFIGEFIDSIDENTHLIILSDHGAGKMEKKFYLNNWLLENGFLFLKNRVSTKCKRFLMRLGLCEADFYNFFVAGNPLARIIDLLVNAKKKEKKNRVFYTAKDIDWTKSLAHGINENQIFINLKEKGDRVEKGTDYEKIRNNLIEKLLKIPHPYKKDQPFISKIHKKEEVFFGEKLSQLPDLILIYDDLEINSPAQVKTSSCKVFDDAEWSGGHRLHGIIFFYGKGVKKNFRIKDANIEDIPATIMALLEGCVPEEFDGKVLKGIFLEDFLGEIRKARISTKKVEKQKVFSDSQEQQVKKTLESLGYI